MSIIIKINQASLNYIFLTDFMFVLSSSNNGLGAFNLLPSLVDKGLPLSFITSGIISDEKILFSGNITDTLKTLEEKLFTTDEPMTMICKQLLVSHQGRINIPFTNLVVKRSDVNKIYFDFGLPRFPWPLVLHPENSEHYSLFSVEPYIEELPVKIERNKSLQTIQYMELAREIGQELMENEQNQKRKPSVIKIAKYVEGELSNRGITGPRGTFLDFETIKREALSGITGKKSKGK